MPTDYYLGMVMILFTAVLVLRMSLKGIRKSVLQFPVFALLLIQIVVFMFALKSEENAQDYKDTQVYTTMHCHSILKRANIQDSLHIILNNNFCDKVEL